MKYGFLTTYVDVSHNFERQPQIMKRTITILILLFLRISESQSQSKISITIDDVPNYKTSYNLIKVLDKLNIPIFIFVNEGRPARDSSPISTNKLLEKWLKRKYINVGNHTKSHLRYSTTELDTFKQDIINGEKITRKLIKRNNKKLKYFRFPFNDLGSDSNAQQKMSDFLISKNYHIAPFTIESSDWMYNSVYEYFLNEKDTLNAKKIGQDYVEKTIEFIDFFEKVSLKYFNRNINQIYLCHDNMINTDFLPEIIEKLKNKNYNFIGLEEALHDEVYSNKNYYSKKWGISWIYRWIENSEDRKRIMQTEPTTLGIEQLYNTIQEKK